jgi:hypothetical protein
LYFDVDWNCYNSPYPKEILPEIFDSDKLVVARERSPYFEFVVQSSQKIDIDPYRYFNAGFYVANRENHYSFFEKCINIYNNVPKGFADQCMMNYVAVNYDYPVHYANRMWNMFERRTWWRDDIRPFVSRFKCVAYHSPYNYDHFEGIIKVDSGDIEVDQKTMPLVSGWYMLKGKNIPETRRVLLLPDGNTDNCDYDWAQDVDGNIYIINAWDGEIIAQFEEVNGFFKSEDHKLVRLN